MNRKRAGLAGPFAALAVALASRPALAQASESTTKDAIWGLNFDLLAVAIPITILVEVILLYTVWRFRASKVEEASPTKENRRLEITWTVATAVVLLFVGIGSYTVLGQAEVSAPGPDEAPQDSLHVQVDAQRYFWHFEYPEQNVTTDSNRAELVVPANQTVRFNVSSRDWLHAFHVPDLGLKADAFPGQSNYIQTTLTQRGRYQLYCAEYCGSGHSQMMAVVNVTTQERFEAWIEQQQGS